MGLRQPPEETEKDQIINSIPIAAINPSSATKSAMVIQPPVNNLAEQADQQSSNNSPQGQSEDGIGQIMQLNKLSDSSNRAPLNNLWFKTKYMYRS